MGCPESAGKRVPRQWRPFAALIAALLAAAVAGADPAADTTAGQAAFEQGDIVGAIAAFRRAAEQGYAPAQVRLGDILDYSELNEEAVAWYRKAAEQGSSAGAYGLGHLYAIGEGVVRDDAVARRWFEKAAAGGHQGALRALESASEHGGLGLDPSPAQAVKWLETSVALPGGEWAAERLAKAYASGELGLAPDAARAAELERRAKAGVAASP